MTKKRRQLISSDEAVPASKPLTQPCSDCPWARTALPGWLGGMSIDEWLQAAHSETLVDCHCTTNQQCAGLAIYRANVLKTPRHPSIQRLPADRDTVFTTPDEFRTHHKTFPTEENMTTEIRTAPLYQVLAQKLAWVPPMDSQFVAQREREIARLKSYLPSGAGWDEGTSIDFDPEVPDRIHLSGSFHHMTKGGVYDGWTTHTITVTPSLAYGFELRISGRNRNDIKDYLHDLFDYALRQDVPEWEKMEAP